MFRKFNNDYKYLISSISGICPPDTAVVTVNVDGACDYLKVEEGSLFEITVYPNPVSSDLTILNPFNTSALKLELYDMRGRLFPEGSILVCFS